MNEPASPPTDAPPKPKPPRAGAAQYESDRQSPAAIRLRKQRMQQADAVAQRMADLVEQIEQRIAPEEMEVWDVHRRTGEPWPEAEALVEFREAQVDQLRELYTKIDEGRTIDVSAFMAIVEALWPMMLEHRQRFTQLALLVPRREDYLPDHAMCVAVLAMATAAQLTWGERDAKLAGLAGLTFDMGMMMVPARIRAGGEQLTDIDRGRVQRHTAYGVVLTDHIEGLPAPVQLAAYQHHERDNASGYPHGLRGEGLHDLSRLIAVADVFAALTSPRGYRQDKLPYTAMEQMVRFAAAGQFDKPATRALVQAAGLFPVGSYVKLSTNRTARIIAANPNHLDRPVIHLLDRAGAAEGQPIDLSRVPADKLKVTRPVAAPAAA